MHNYFKKMYIKSINKNNMLGIYQSIFYLKIVDSMDTLKFKAK